MLEGRPLGRTGHQATVIGLGGAFLSIEGHRRGVATVNRAIDLGVNYLDTASTYGDGHSEECVGEVMRTRRDEVFLATKILKRGKAEAAEEFRESLRRLQTDHVDLLQIHAVQTRAMWDEVAAPEGSLAAAVEAREKGLARFIGITGHHDPEPLIVALRAFPFATVFFPVNAAETHLGEFTERLVPVARERGAGVLAMKVLAEGALAGHVDEAIRFALSRPIDVAILGARSPAEIEAAVRAAEAHRPLTADEERALVETAREVAAGDRMWWRKRKY